jgi:hypothetical protein
VDGEDEVKDEPQVWKIADLVDYQPCVPSAPIADESMNGPKEARVAEVRIDVAPEVKTDESKPQPGPKKPPLKWQKKGQVAVDALKAAFAAAPPACPVVEVGAMHHVPNQREWHWEDDDGNLWPVYDTNGQRETSLSFSESFHDEEYSENYLRQADEMNDILAPAWVPVAPLVEVKQTDLDCTSADAGIKRMPPSDHKAGEFGGPGDDGYLLVNFAGRNLQLEVSQFRGYSMPSVKVIGEEAFQKIYAHYPPNFVGFSWQSDVCTVSLPPCLVEPVCAYALTKLHDREGFELVQKHVIELLYNVRCSPEWYRAMVEFTPFVAWYSVNNEKLHGLQRYVDGEYWDCKRIRQAYCRGFICCVLILALLLGLGLGAYFTYASLK